MNDSPVVLIHGPRQCGKTTLARHVAELKGYDYFTFDDDIQRSAAHTDPVGYVAELPEHVVLDEVQRVPELFTSLKIEIDKRRTPGRFILTGSANVLFVPSLSDSLAGRIEILRLHPLSHIFLLEELPPWHSNRTKRLIKTPKLHIGDTGLVCALLGLNADTLLKDRSFGMPIT